jgi:hypothetical protein
MNLHAVARSRGWAVFGLADGSTDNVPYETYGDALRSTSWDRDWHVYLQIQPDGMPAPLAQRYLDYARLLHEHGARMPDPRDLGAPDRDFPYHAPPLMRSDWPRQIRLAKGQH